MRAVYALLFLALVAGARAQTGASATATAANTVTDASLQEAITKAMKSVFGGSASPMGAAMPNPMGALKSTLSTAAAAAAAQLEAAAAAFDEQYCTPATFEPSEKVPATFTGHSMSVVFSMGNCTFDDSKWMHEGIKELNCTEPSITYTKTPANFTSKYVKAPSFTAKECKIEKTFGEEMEKVIFVFDGQQAPDINTLTAKVVEEVKSVLGTVANGATDLIKAATQAASGVLSKKKAGMMGVMDGVAPAFTYA